VNSIIYRITDLKDYVKTTKLSKISKIKDKIQYRVKKNSNVIKAMSILRNVTLIYNIKYLKI